MLCIPSSKSHGLRSFPSAKPGPARAIAEALQVLVEPKRKNAPKLIMGSDSRVAFGWCTNLSSPPWKHWELFQII
ncbi:hypothetical protein V6N11_025164 [Hibiscus sabdariffa]|uniref:Uncharacterized protein n=1 Tax=Hibiscus sabdariffa TaxID=183260 RepID=A0ABR2QP89_9ROSI